MAVANNQLVSIVLENIYSVDNDLITSTSSDFITHLSPLLSSPYRVRKIAGSYLSDISDDVLNQLILKYSLEAECIAVCDTTTFDKWDFYAEKWVNYNTALFAIYNSPVFLGESGGKSYKKLGDFSISKDSRDSGDSSGPAKSFMKKLECELFKIEISVRLCQQPLLECDSDALGGVSTHNPSAALTVVKGGSVVGRPSFGRTFTQQGQHPAWTGWIEKNGRKQLTNYNPADRHPYSNDPNTRGY